MNPKRGFIDVGALTLQLTFLRLMPLLLVLLPL